MKVGHFKEFLVREERGSRVHGLGSGNLRTLPPPLRIIKVIHAMPQGMNFGNWKGILNVLSTSEGEASN